MKGLSWLCFAGLFLCCTGNKAAKTPDAETVLWVELFAEETWNNFEEGELAVFRGIVKYVPAKNVPGFVQRYNPYKLGEDDIYCGSSDALGDYVGKEVEIKGKTVVTSLEGTEFSEIWPSRIRVVSEKSQ